jgi:hypothetical protein
MRYLEVNHPKIIRYRKESSGGLVAEIEGDEHDLEGLGRLPPRGLALDLDLRDHP